MTNFNIKYMKNGENHVVKSTFWDSDKNMRELNEEGATNLAFHYGDNLMWYYAPGSECLSGPCPHW